MGTNRTSSEWAISQSVETTAPDSRAQSDDSPPLHRRRRIFPYAPHYQASLLAFVWFLTALGMALGVLGGGAFFMFVFEPTRLTPVGDFSALAVPVILGGLVALGLLGWLSMLVTHRIAGPIYRVLQGLDSLAHGEFDSKTRLRRSDAFQELAEQLNVTVESLRREREMAHKRAEALRAELDALAERCNENARIEGDARETLDRARKLCSELTGV